jgi:hypothetical protein
MTGDFAFILAIFPRSGKTGLESLKPEANDLLQKWSVSKRVNNSRALDEDATLIQKASI